MKIRERCFAFLALLLVPFSVFAVGEATSFVYPVGNKDMAPNELYGNANGFQITQNFNTSPVYFGTQTNPNNPNGAWCNNTTAKIYTDQVSCTNAGFRWSYGHTGVDLANGQKCNSVNVPIYAIANGVVVKSEWYNGYGNLLVIKHTLPNRRIIYSLYGHRKTPMLAKGDVVNKGQLVGYVGDTDSVGRCHLHFAIYDQEMLNKIQADSVPVGYVFSDKGELTSGGNKIPANIMRYFYDPLLFVSDRRNEWQNTPPYAGRWNWTFMNTLSSVSTRTMYVVNNATGEMKSLIDAKNAGWISADVLWSSPTGWRHWTAWSTYPMDSYSVPPGGQLSFQTFIPNLTFRWHVPGNEYLHGRLLQDMNEFTTVNASLGFLQAKRETYQKVSCYGDDPTNDCYTIKFQQKFNGVIYDTTVEVSHVRSDQMIRYISFYDLRIGQWSNWIRVY